MAANPTDIDAVVAAIRAQAQAEDIRVTQHAQQEMVEEDITLDETLEALLVGTMLENYPLHQRGACCLVHGVTRVGRSLHIVCTTTRPILIIITVYEPKPPKWQSPTQRRQHGDDVQH